MESACFAGFFLGKWGLKVTGNKELQVIPHIYCRIVWYCLRVLIKLYLCLTSGDVVTLLRSVTKYFLTAMIWGRPIPNTKASKDLWSWSTFHEICQSLIQIRWKFYTVLIQDFVKRSLWNFAHGTTCATFCSDMIPTMKLHWKSSFHRIWINLGISLMNWAPGVRLNVKMSSYMYTWVLWYCYLIFIMETPIPERWHLINSILSKAVNPSH